MSKMNSPSPRNQGRRDFLKIGGAATAALLTPSAFAVTPNKSLPTLPSNPRTPDGHAHAQPGQDRIQGRHLLAGRPGCAREAEQLRRRGADRRARARSRRELPRHFFHLRRSRSLERAVRRQGDGEAPQRGVPRDQDQGADARRLDAHDREVAAAAADRSRRPVAAARHRHHVRRRRRSSPRAAPWKR